MPRKKKPNNTKVKKVKQQNESEYHNDELTVTNTENTSTRLSLLPADVLFYIFKFLSPADLVSLLQLDPKFKEVIVFQRELNFSICRRADVELLSSFFSRESVKRIQKLNFNAYFFAKPCDLVQIICRCRNLINLSVIECGINYKQILKILKSCSVLQELSWSVKECVEIEPNFHSSVTKLFLLFEINRYTDGAHRILSNFPNIEKAVICCSPELLTLPPFCKSWSKSITLSSDDNLRWITVISNALHENIVQISSSPVLVLILEIERLFHLTSSFRTEAQINPDNFYYDHPPFLKVDWRLVTSFLSTTYTDVIICICPNSFDRNERLFNSVSKVIDSKLKHLSLECRDYDTSISLPFKSQDPQIFNLLSNYLGTLLLHCENITVLNFGDMHFHFGSPLKAMCNLKNLKFLNMPTCAFPKNLSDSTNLNNEDTEDESSSFEEFVSKCCNVEDFHLVCCYADKGRMLDSEIFPIENWKKLISFSIYSVIFSSCRFLRKIADRCPNFQFFSYIDTAPNCGCIFYEDVIHLLTYAKNLSFIRINCRNFNPEFERFLYAVSLAKNLEGICILTNLDKCYNTSAFLNSIQSLKYLHLFHFQAPRVSERLYTEVRRSMDSNNIKNIKIERECLSPTTSTSDRENLRHDADSSEYFHCKPFFTCKRMHLKKFFSDSRSYFDAM